MGRKIRLNLLRKAGLRKKFLCLSAVGDDKKEFVGPNVHLRSLCSTE